MMGEYILYFRDKIIGGVYDDRLLVKPVRSAISLMPAATYELPYKGAKEMLLVDDIDNKELLCRLFLSMYDELPAPKKKKTSKIIATKNALSYELLPTAEGVIIWIPLEPSGVWTKFAMNVYLQEHILAKIHSADTPQLGNIIYFRVWL